MPYRYELYNFQDSAKSGAAHAQINAMEEDGWRPHTVSASFTELSILWVKEAPAKDAEGAKDRKAAVREEEKEGADSPAETPKQDVGRHSRGSKD